MKAEEFKNQFEQYADEQGVPVNAAAINAIWKANGTLPDDRHRRVVKYLRETYQNDYKFPGVGILFEAYRATLEPPVAGRVVGGCSAGGPVTMRPSS